MAVHLSGGEKLPGTGGTSLAILSAARYWYCVLGDKVISLVTGNDRWRMSDFPEVSLVHVAANTWLFVNVALTLGTVQLVLGGANWISSSGCGAEQIGSQHGWQLLNMEVQDFTLMIAQVFLKCSLKDTEPTTVLQHPRTSRTSNLTHPGALWSWPIGRSVQKDSSMVIWISRMAQRLACAWQNFQALIIISLPAAVMAHP